MLKRARVLLGFLVALCAPAIAKDHDQALLERISNLERRIENVEAIDQIRLVAHSYGFYMDNALLDQVKALFADEMEYCEIGGYGRYNGREGCLKVWTSVVGPGLQNKDGHLRYGRLIKHYLVKDAITISEDGLSAEGRFDYLGFSGVFKNPERTYQQMGVYQMGFRKEGGVWKISRFALTFDAVDYNSPEWATKPIMRCPRKGAPPPDAENENYHPFPEHGMPPFHYPNPVSGETIADYVNPLRYWEGNWPGEFGEACGMREDAYQAVEPTQAAPLSRAN